MSRSAIAASLIGSALLLLACERRVPVDASIESAIDDPTMDSTHLRAAQNGSDAGLKEIVLGTIVGRIVYDGSPSELTTMYIIEAGHLEAHTVITDPKTRGLKNAVVWVESVPARIPPEALSTVIQDQNNWTFRPHVLAVRALQTVRFVNSDLSNHNVHSVTPGAEFNFATPGSKDYQVTYRFRRPTGTDPVKLACDTHTWMRGWVYVFEHDAYAVTDATGKFRIDAVPAGSRRLRVHHADGSLEATQEIVVERAGETTTEIIVSG